MDREEKITANRLQLHVSVAQKESYSKQQNEMLISEDLKKQEQPESKYSYKQFLILYEEHLSKVKNEN